MFKMRKIVREHFLILFIMILFFVIKVIFSFKFHDVGWDEGVYLGMGKYFYSLGTIGLWEIIRPILLPLLLGSIWAVGLRYVFWAEALALLFALGNIFFVYLIGKKIWNKQVGLVSALLFSATPLFFLYSGYILTGIPSTFFILFGIYLFLCRSFLYSGILLGLGFITRFPAGIFFGILFLLFMYLKKRKELPVLIKGFFVPLVPYFLFNYFMYRKDTAVAWHAIFRPWILAFSHQTNPAEFMDEGLFYIVKLLDNNFLLILCVLGLFFYLINLEFAKRRFSLDKTVLVLCFLIPILYFSIIPNRQIRFALLFLPFIVLLGVGGLWEFAIRFRKLKTTIWYTVFGVLLILLLLYIVPADLGYYNWRAEAPEVVTEFYPSLAGLPSGNILTADPVVVAYVDRLFIPYYFSLPAARQIFAEYKDTSAGILHISDSFFCEEGDAPCQDEVQAFDVQVEEGMKLQLHSTHAKRKYYLYVPTT